VILPLALRHVATAAAMLALAWLAACAGLYFLQRSLMYHGRASRPDPALAGVAGIDVRRLATADGLGLLAWYAAPAQGRPVALFLHGNAGDIGGRAGRVAQYAASGWGVLLVEWRGFGGNPGAPSEEGLARDAEAAHAELLALGIPPGRIVIWGESLGTAPAVRLARTHAARALVLEAPFTSMADMARRRYPFVPVDLLLKDRHDSLRRIATVATPLLVIHGSKDALIPPAMGELLVAASPAAVKRFHALPEADHNTLSGHGAVRIGIDFVDALPPA
jgi:fermentation-respiration switch protein FrsA (DUF1100 family)